MHRHKNSGRQTVLFMASACLVINNLEQKHKETTMSSTRTLDRKNKSDPIYGLLTDFKFLTQGNAEIFDDSNQIHLFFEANFRSFSHGFSLTFGLSDSSYTRFRRRHFRPYPDLYGSSASFVNVAPVKPQPWRQATVFS